MKLIQSMINLLYPRRCPFCDGILERQEPYLCRECLPRMAFLTGAVCLSCGKPLEKDQEEYCFDCRKKRHAFTMARAPFLYRGVVKESLMRFKYLGRAEYALFYGRAMTEYGRRQQIFAGKDLILPVPVHSARRIQRGYNQAELLARQISRHTGIPMEAGLLLRKRRTTAQKAVGGEGRGRNLEGAFSLSKKGRQALKGRQILLVDDIYTTGSTVDALSLVLLAAGAGSVTVLCLSVSPGFS